MPSSLDALPNIGAPATRALNAAGYTALRQLADAPRPELAQLHGVGPKALGIIQAALEEHGLTLGDQGERVRRFGYPSRRPAMP